MWKKPRSVTPIGRPWLHTVYCTGALRERPLDDSLPSPARIIIPLRVWSRDCGALRSPRGQRSMSSLSGIHHVTAIASDPQRNLDFYTGLLGLRLVKRTVNFDDPQTYHFYFG